MGVVFIKSQKSGFQREKKKPKTGLKSLLSQ